MKKKTETQTQTPKPNHRTMSFRKARLVRENAPRYDCGCINHGDDANVGCESCRHQSCLDCHHIDTTSANVDDWKCKEGYGCKSHDSRGEEE